MDGEKNISNFNQALWLGIGQLCTYLIAFLTAPILTRYFDKIEYGTYRQILYVYSSLMSLFTLGLPTVFAYFIPRMNAPQQKTLIKTINRIFTGLGLLFSCMLYFTSDYLADILNNPELATGLKLFSPFPLFTLPTMGVEGIYTALKKTKFIAIYQVVSKSLMFLCIVLPVIIFNTGYKEAIIGWGIASFITFIMAMHLKNRPYVGVKAEYIPNLYKSIFIYCLPLTGAFITGFVCNSSDQFFVSRYYGIETYALYATGIFTIPIIPMIASSVKNVLVPIISKAEADNRLSEALVTYRTAVKRSSLIIIPMLAFCFFFSTDIMIALFGKPYASSSSYFKINIIKDLILIFPYFALLAALGLNKFYMNLHVIGAIAIPALDIIICKLMLPSQFILVVSASFFILCSVSSFLYLKKKKNLIVIDRDLINYLLGMILHCTLILGILYILRIFLFQNLNVFISLFLLGSVYYGLLISSGYMLDYQYAESLTSLIKRKNEKR